MVKLILPIFFLISLNLKSQIIPNQTSYNQNIIWESVFTDGPPGKVNRGVVDSDGNCAVVFMPDNMARVHKIDGNSGELIWTKSIYDKIGFGISEINNQNRVDYLISGGAGNSQERWLCRLNGDDGSIMWEQTYTYSGNQYQFDGIRMTTFESDGYIYASGFIGGDEAGTIFIVYGGQAMIMKIDPTTGNEIWTHTNYNSEYALSVVMDNNQNLYYWGVMYDDNLKITKVNTNGEEIWTRDLSNTINIIPADLAIDKTNETILYGCHTARQGDGEPFDYTCVSLDYEANINWIKHYANPRGYSLDEIRNELYGIKVRNGIIYMFGGSGDESNYSAYNPPFEPSDVWNGWVLQTNLEGNILQSDVFCHDNVNTATEYGDLTENGYVIFNDTDAQGDTEVGVIKVSTENNTVFIQENPNNKKTLIKKINLVGQIVNKNLDAVIFEIYDDGSVLKKINLNYCNGK